MSDLLLRVSTIKSSQNLKKNSEIRMEVMKLPDKWVWSVNNDHDNLLRNFASASSIQEQLQVIQELRKMVLLVNASAEHIEKTLAILFDLYFEAPLKHAVRAGTQKILQNCQKEEALREIVIENVEKRLVLDNLTWESVSRLINSLDGCFENFPILSTALLRIANKLMGCLGELSTFLLGEMSKTKTPATASELNLIVHNLLRLILAVLSQSQKANLNSIYSEKDLLVHTQNAQKLLAMPDFPMDARMNSAILILTVACIRNFDKNLIERIVKQQNDKTDVNTITLMAIVNVFDMKTDQSFVTFTKIVKKIVSNEGIHLMGTQIALVISRGVSMITKKLVRPADERRLEQLIEMLHLICKYIWNNLDNPVDTIRYLSKESLENAMRFVILHRSESFESFVREEIFNYLSEETTSLSIRFTGMNILSKLITSDEIFSNFPDLCHTLVKALKSDRACDATNAVSCYETLMIDDFNERTDFRVWYDKWLSPLIDEMHVDLITVETLVNRAVHKKPQLFTAILNNKHIINKKALYLFLANGRKSGMLDEKVTTDDMWKGTESFEQIKNAMVCFDDSTRITALRLLCEARKSTETIAPAELDCLSYFLEYNIASMCSSFRQKVMGLLNNFLTRLSTVYVLAFKKKQLEHTDSYRAFLQNLHNFCIRNLEAGANMSRRNVSLSLLLRICGIVGEIEASTKTELIEWTEKDCRNLIATLNDSFEANKKMAMLVLKLCPPAVRCSDLSFNDIVTLAKSTKPTDSANAVFHLEYLAFISDDCQLLSALSECTVTGIKNENYYHILVWCKGHLKRSLEVARGSILQAARTNPLYGLLYCIRHLLDAVKWTEIADHPEWQSFFEDLIILAKDLTDVVSPIVNSSSPEGHLPNDFSEVPDSIEATSEPTGTTSQMVVLCAWRTVKEVSLLLGDIALHAPFKTANTSGLITAKQILGIGQHFTKMLAETKHRGAFEQTYVGFSKLCARLWTTNEVELEGLPMKWLEKLMDIIGDASELRSEVFDFNVEKLCATRRSAGIPFMVQALITAEFQVGSAKSLKWCMGKLLELCKFGKTTDSRTHAMNILRALFRCTDLGDAVGCYVGDGLMAAIEGYSALSWPERNSSTLMFAALMTRIFGVQRSKDSDNLNIRNRMTGRIFFLRYPQLYDFLEAEFKTTDVNSSRMQPTLLLLNRLYVSGLEGSESSLKLDRFLEHLPKMQASAIYKNRVLAAKAFANLMRTDNVPKYLCEMDCTLQSLRQSTNGAHGKLLLILQLVRKVMDWNAIPHTKQSSIAKNILQMDIFRTSNFFLQKTYADILMELIMRMNGKVLRPIFEEYFAVANGKALRKSIDVISWNVTSIGKRVASNSIILFLYLYENFMRTPIDTTDMVSEWCAALINTDSGPISWDSVDATLTLYFLIIQSGTDNLFDEIEVTKLQNMFVEYLKSHSDLPALRKDVCKNSSVAKLLQNVASNKQCYPILASKALAIISASELFIRTYLDVETFDMHTVGRLIEYAVDKPDDIRLSIYECIRTVFASESFTDWSHLDLDFLLCASGEENPDNIRFSSIGILKLVGNAIKTLSAAVPLCAFAQFNQIMLQLFRDDNPDVRLQVSTVVNELSNLAYENVAIASVAQRRHLLFVTEQLIDRQFEPSQVVCFHIAAIAMQEMNAFDIGDNKRCVFDKNETNLFGELCSTITDCRHELNCVMDKYGLSMPGKVEICKLIEQYYSVGTAKALLLYLNRNGK